MNFLWKYDFSIINVNKTFQLLTVALNSRLLTRILIKKLTFRFIRQRICFERMVIDMHVHSNSPRTVSPHIFKNPKQVIHHSKAIPRHDVNLSGNENWSNHSFEFFHNTNEHTHTFQNSIRIFLKLHKQVIHHRKIIPRHGVNLSGNRGCPNHRFDACVRLTESVSS